MKIKLDHIAIFSIIFISILYYNVSLNSPIVFGDEGYYTYLAKWMAENQIIPVYRVLYETSIAHPKFWTQPLFSFIEAFMWMLLGEPGIKILLPIFSILTAFLIYIFMRDLNQAKAGLAATFIFLLTPALITYGVLAYTDTMLVLFFMCFVIFSHKAFETNRKIHIILASIFISLAILTKITAVVGIPLLLVYFILSKNKSWKNIAIFLIITAILSSSWAIRNLILFGDTCYNPLPPPACMPKMDMQPKQIEGLNFAGRTAEAGTEAGVWKMGILSFSNFAFGWTIPVLLIFGVTLLFFRNDKFKLFLILWLLLIILLFFSTTIEISKEGVKQAGGRAEDTARYILIGIPAIAILSGIFVVDSYEFIRKYNSIIAFIFILIFLYSIFVYGYEKLNTMSQVKHFPDGFFNACDWVKKNTPKDSILYAVYSQQTAYNCDRKASRPEYENEEIQLTGNNSTYDYLKIHGYDYIFVPVNLISGIPYSESYSVIFMQYISSSPNFKLVFDNTKTYENGGVVIFQILPNF